MTDENPNAFEAELERAGENVVRLKLAKGIYGAGKRPIVEAWLRKLDVEKQARGRKEEAEHKYAEQLKGSENNLRGQYPFTMITVLTHLFRC